MKKYLILVWLFLLVAPLGAQQTFTISSSYNNLLSNPAGDGLLDLLLTEAFDRLGISVTIIYNETAHSLIDVNAGVYDAEINRIEGIDHAYPYLVRVPEPNMEMRFTAFVKKNIAIKSWDDLTPYRVGLVRGWKILEEHTRTLPVVYTVSTEVQLFRMLEAGRIDAALYAERTGRAVVTALGLAGISHIDPPLASRPMYLYLHDSHAALAAPMAEVLKQMKVDGSYDAIMGDNR